MNITNLVTTTLETLPLQQLLIAGGVLAVGVITTVYSGLGGSQVNNRELENTDLNRKTVAATKFQALSRGYIQRLSQVNNRELENTDLNRKTVAATKFQALSRGYIQRLSQVNNRELENTDLNRAPVVPPSSTQSTDIKLRMLLNRQ